MLNFVLKTVLFTICNMIMLQFGDYIYSTCPKETAVAFIWVLGTFTFPVEYFLWNLISKEKAQ